MKIRILSDLHLERNYFTPSVVDADVTVLAGDIHNGVEGIKWAKETFDNKIFYVAGNHEFYSHKIDSMYEELGKYNTSNFTFIENNYFVYKNIFFIGCTLWSDFNLYGNPKLAMMESKYKISDFKQIKNSNGSFFFSRRFVKNVQS